MAPQVCAGFRVWGEEGLERAWFRDPKPLHPSPQAVPFARRVELFRALLEEDKRRGGYGRSIHEGGVPPVQVGAGRRMAGVRWVKGEGRGHPVHV